MNGVLDNQAILIGSILTNDGDVYIGKDPWHMGFKGYIDDLRYYSEVLNGKELLSLAGPVVPLAAVQGVKLGCQLCNYGDAESSCQDNFHLCSL